MLEWIRPHRSIFESRDVQDFQNPSIEIEKSPETEDSDDERNHRDEGIPEERYDIHLPDHDFERRLLLQMEKFDEVVTEREQETQEVCTVHEETVRLSLSRAVHLVIPMDVNPEEGKPDIQSEETEGDEAEETDFPRLALGLIVLDEIPER